MSGADDETDSPRVRVGPYTIRCSRRGDTGRPLLLLNGLGLGFETWEPFRHALLPRRTLALDLPGTGGSTTPMRPLTIAELGRITARALDEVGEDQVDVLGFSFGGTVAQELARVAPARVAHLILAATNGGHGSPLGSPVSIANWLAASGRRMFARNVLGPWWQMLAVSAWSSWAWLDQLPQPTLVLAAGADEVVPLAAGRRLAAELPNARLVVVERARHGFLLDADAPRAARLVLEFLAEDDSPALGVHP
jgi:pimeloyl-ACP methyl ester carboxylesterase